MNGLNLKAMNDSVWTQFLPIISLFYNFLAN